MRSRRRKYLITVRDREAGQERTSEIVSFDPAPTWQTIRIAFPNGKLAYLNEATGNWEATGTSISELSSAHQLLSLVRRLSYKEGFTIAHVEALLVTLGVWCFGDLDCDSALTACRSKRHAKPDGGEK